MSTEKHCPKCKSTRPPQLVERGVDIVLMCPLCGYERPAPEASIDEPPHGEDILADVQAALAGMPLPIDVCLVRAYRRYTGL